VPFLLGRRGRTSGSRRRPRRGTPGRDLGPTPPASVVCQTALQRNAACRGFRLVGARLAPPARSVSDLHPTCGCTRERAAGCPCAPRLKRGCAHHRRRGPNIFGTADASRRRGSRRRTASENARQVRDQVEPRQGRGLPPQAAMGARVAPQRRDPAVGLPDGHHDRPL